MNLQAERNMYAPSSAGKIVGALFLIQMAVGIYINFALLPTLSWEPGALAAEAPSGIKFGLITLLALVNSSFNLVVGIIGYLIFKKYNPLLALMVLVFPGVSLALTGVEYARFLELVFYSQHYQAASAEAKVLLETFRPVFAASRDWAHYIAIGFSGFSVFLFYSLLLQSARMPRLLAGFGALAAASQVCGVSMGLMGNSVPMLMLLPLALAQLILPLYLIVKGLAVRDDLVA
jgi:hypothetical protein